MTEETILNGQTAWQSISGMQVGFIWGHGAYQAPDWSADWLHRELLAWLNLSAQAEYGMAFNALPADVQAKLKFDLKQTYRKNTYNAGTGVLTVTPRQASAMAEVSDYYQRLFGNDASLAKLRDGYAMKTNTLPDVKLRADLGDFFFCT